MKYKVENTGYNNNQVVIGYMELEVEGIDDLVSIEVVEHSISDMDVKMYINTYLNNDTEKEQIFKVFDLEKYDEGVYELTDDNLVSELFSQYGNNA